MNRVIAILAFGLVGLFISKTEAGPTTQPLGPLTITAGGTYSGVTCTSVIIRTNDAVVLNRLTIVGPGENLPPNSDGTPYIPHSLITISGRPDLTVTNCVFSSQSPSYAITTWSFSRFVFEHNSLIGTAGIRIGDKAPSQIHINFNSATDISGIVTPGVAPVKASFIQLDATHCADIEIGFNSLVNHPGTSATEDSISMMQSGGTETSHAKLHDNCIDGVFAYPRGTNSSGSGIMCYDPGNSSGLTDGGYTDCYNNIVIGVENTGIACAGSHDVQIYDNLVVNDGTTTTMTHWGYHVWNWFATGMQPTPPAFFRTFNVHDNSAHCFRGTTRVDYDFFDFKTPLPPQTTLLNNLSVTTSDETARADWQSKITSAKPPVVVGPVPESFLATGTFGMKYSDASAGVKLVPLPTENLGGPTAIGYLDRGSWLKYSGVDFGEGVSTLTVTLASPSAGQSFTVRADSSTGPIIATVPIPNTGGWYMFTPTPVQTTGWVNGVHDMFLVFNGPANIKTFAFTPTPPSH